MAWPPKLTVRRTAGKRARGAPTALLTTALLAACAGSSGPNLGAFDVSTPPAGYTLGPPGDNRSFTTGAIAETSPVARSLARSHLAAAGVHGGYGHVFVDGSDFAVLIVMQARDSAHAATLAKAEAAATVALADTASWTPTIVPDAYGYLFNGQLSGQSSFCQGAWVSKGRLVFHAYTCENDPAGVTVLEVLMREEDALLP